MAVLVTRSVAKVFKKCCVSNAVNGTDDDVLWNGSEEDENVRSECEEVKMETVILIDKGR